MNFTKALGQASKPSIHPLRPSRHSSGAAVYTSCITFQLLASQTCSVNTSAESTLFVAGAPVQPQIKVLCMQAKPKKKKKKEKRSANVF